MRNDHPASSLDWLVLTVRWILIVAVCLWLAMGESLTGPVLAFLILGAATNAILTGMVLSGRETLTFRLISVGLDFLYSTLFFYFSGPSEGNLGWVGVLPIFSASIYFRWIGLITILLLNLFVQGLIAQQLVPLDEALLFVGMLSGVYLVIGLLSIVASRRLESKGVIAPKARPAKPPTINVVDVEQRRVVYNLISALSASLNYQKVLEASLELSSQTLSELNAPAEQLVSAVLLFAHSNGKPPELQIAASRRLLPSDVRVTLPGTSGLIGQAIDSGEPSFSRFIKKDPELNRFVALQPCQSAFCFPLRMGLEAYGALLFAHPDPDFFSDDRREVLGLVGKQSIIALQNARLYSDLEQEKERMMEIQEDARKKMARDLHDGPTQSVSAIAMRVNFARRLLERDSRAAGEELFKIEELARRTTKEIRHMLFTLRPLVLESQGLVAALQSMAEKMHDTYEQNVVIQADQRVVEALEAGKQAIVFYIVEEAVNNARKHAHADHVWVRLKMMKEDLGLIEIEDDGVGFDTESVDASYDHRGSLGMINMRERAELISGVLQIDSAEGKGTRVQVVFPLSAEGADRLRQGL